MSEIIKLIEYGENMVRGDILRCKGSWPYEEYVDFMFVDYPFNNERQHALLIVSGYKSGLTLVVLPKEANDENTISVKIDWLKTNWSSWVYPDCPLEEVYVLFKKTPKTLYD